MYSCRWGSDYLLKTLNAATDANGSTTEIIYQVGNQTLDAAYWGRPEDITFSRPYYQIDASLGASDLAGDVIAALAASASVHQSLNKAYYNQLMTAAHDLYFYATSDLGLYSDQIDVRHHSCPSAVYGAMIADDL